MSLGAYNNRNDRQNLFSQTDLVWENRLGGIDQTLLLGFEVGRERSRNRRNTGSFPERRHGADHRSDRRRYRDLRARLPTIPNNRVEGDASPRCTCRTRSGPPSGSRSSPGCASTVSSSTSTISARSAAGEFGRRDHLWSPRLGLILKPTERPLALRAATAAPICRNRATSSAASTPITDGLEPERFDNLEAGAKWEILDGLLATAAIYQLDRSNTRAADPLDPSRTVLTGKQRSRGLELGLERSVTSRWLISAGYALQKAEITETTTAAPEGPQSPAGPAPQFLAVEPLRRHQASGLGPGHDRALEILRDDQQCGEAAGLHAGRRGALLQDFRTASRRSSTSRICSARIISRPPTATIISRPARRGRSRRRSAIGLLARPAPSPAP